MGGMKRASADSCAVCNAIKFAVADALHEYDKQTYERCAKHMRTARREALDAAREAVAAKAMHSPKCFALLPDFDERDCNCAVAYSLAAIDALKEKP